MSAEKKKKQIEVTFNGVAERYDTNQFFRISAEAMVGYLQLNGSTRMLDVSTGTGVVAITVAQKYQRMDIEAIDISEGMLNQARKKAKSLNIHNIHFKRMDAEQMEYIEASFDVITCGYGLFFYPDIETTFRSIYKLLKGNGQFLFSTFTKDAFNPYAEQFLGLLKEYGVEAPELSRTRLQDETQVKELCSHAGVGNIQVKSHEIRYKITIDDWWELLSNAGYKALLDQVQSKRQREFKQRHLEQVSQLSEHGEVLLNADSLYAIVSK